MPAASHKLNAATAVVDSIKLCVLWLKYTTISSVTTINCNAYQSLTQKLAWLMTEKNAA